MTQQKKQRPPLLTFAICERVLREEDRVATLVRLVDKFTVGVVVGGGTEEELRQMAVQVDCNVFLRWGPGEGTFAQELRIVTPDETEKAPVGPITITAQPGLHFMQTTVKVSLGVKESGVYKFRVYLDGEFVQEHPFSVAIEKRRVQ
jgi:hypothetical protein